MAPARAPAPAVDASLAASADAALKPLHVKLLAFNDFHGNLRPPTGGVHGIAGPVGGADFLAAHLKRLGAGQPNTLVVAAGDLIGASPLTSALFHDEPTIDAMNLMGLTVTSLGNHELDEGIVEVLRMRNGGCHPKDGCVFDSAFAGAQFDILAANVTEKATGKLELPAFAIREVEGIPIGFIGLTLEDTPSVVLPSGVEGLKFGNELQTVAAVVPELKKRGVEAIVLLIHQGGTVNGGGLDDCNDLRGAIVDITEKLDPAVDVVVSGHTHALYNCRVGGRSVTSALSFGRVVTELDLSIDRKTRDVIKVEAHNHAVTHDVDPDPAVHALIERAVTLAGPRENRVVGHITATFRAATGPSGESALGDLIADAQLEATRTNGAVMALMNTGGLRSDLLYEKSTGETADGQVTYGEIFSAQPFGNGLVTLTLSGADLLDLIEHQGHVDEPLQVSEGVTYRWSAQTKPRITDLQFRGKAVRPEDRLRVTVNTYLAESIPVLRKATERKNGPTDLDALERYMKAHAKLALPKTPRIQRAAGE